MTAPDGLTDEQLLDFIAHLGGAPVEATQHDGVDHLTWALFYATMLGWPVFPLVPGGKQPATAHGFKDATTDAGQVRAWWTAMPYANIGTPTGAAGCGSDVLDVDTDAKWADPLKGFRSLFTIKHAACPPGCSNGAYCPATGALPPVTARVITPRGGRHYFTPASDGAKNSSNALPGIDTRAAGGFVVLPPSYSTEQGRRYVWQTPPPVPS